MADVNILIDVFIKVEFEIGSIRRKHSIFCYSILYDKVRFMHVRLKSFSIENYRSISSARKINLGDITVLIGKNNEGKTNILNALTIAMEAIERFSIAGSTQRGLFSSRNRRYVFDRDFPKNVDEEKCASIFELEFELGDEEIKAFRKDTGLKNNHILFVKIEFEGENSPNISFPKKRKETYDLKKKEISRFIKKNMGFNSIPAIRTETTATEALERVLNNELFMLEERAEYREAVDTIKYLQAEVLDNIAKRMEKPLKDFIPTIREVKISADRYEPRYRIERDLGFQIDDGVLTNISLKGDGVKNLATLAILNETYTNAKSIIAIEEPESHLHPMSIHKLVKTIEDLKENNQVIVTTHSPLFVRTCDLASNIIVNEGKAEPATNIKEIREVLGVSLFDNLLNAEYVLVVEGERDKDALNKLFKLYSKKIQKQIGINKFSIMATNGVGNLSTILKWLRFSMCNYFVLLDDDQEGRDAIDKAEKEGLITENIVWLCSYSDRSQSEFEDCINPEIYLSAIGVKYNVELKKEDLEGGKKWSECMKKVFRAKGKPFDDDIKNDLKSIVSECIKKSELNIFREDNCEWFNSLIKGLESELYR